MSKKNTKQVKESMKASENNWLNKLTEEELAYYYRICNRLQNKYDKYEVPTYKETKAKINKARRSGTMYETMDRHAVFQYIYAMRYTVDLVATYDCRKTNHNTYKGKIYESKRICLINMYLYIRETEEVIYIPDHMWVNEDICKDEIRKYYLQYGDISGGIVYLPYMKGLKYGESYRKDIPLENTRYQLVAGSKHDRTEFVAKQRKRAGLEYGYNYVRKHLYEF